MRFSTAACSVILAAASMATGVDAFAPAVQPRPAVMTPTTTTTSQLSMSNNNNNDGGDAIASNQAKKVAMSFLAASAIAFSTTVAPSADFGFEVNAGVQPVYAADKKAAAVKLSKEEQELVSAKKNYELSQQTLKAYEKLVTENKKTQSTLVNKLESATKSAESAKKSAIQASDKLSMAKNQKMPSAAIQELTTKSNAAKAESKVKEQALSDASNKAKQASKELSSNESSVNSSKDAVKKAKKRVEKAEKVFKKYTKKVAEQKKKDEKIAKKKQQEYAKKLKEQQEKVKKLEKEATKLQKAKKSETKAIADKQKSIESELKALEKLKTSSK